jgi:hypothetical protein
MTRDDFGALVLGTIVTAVFFVLTVNGWWA